MALFGVNYSTAFAYAFRAHERLGVDHKLAIDADVAHLARMRLDAFRIHVWDREVSDRDGNLLENEHLDLLDYLIYRLSERGIKTILTPIAWWPAGYPEPDPGTSGLSDGYSKSEMSLDPESRRAQVNYLAQFISHENPYRGFSYRDDPDVIAIEIYNEPNHGGSPDQTTAYINTLVGALRGEGLTKPIFYNISEGYSDEQARGICSADIQGVATQWYPTGLVRGRTLRHNPLPNVDSYPLPFSDFAECADKARMIYEYDAADVVQPIMYPAMARAFRGSGYQWATQFAYDPLYIAHSNTEYQTHFLNLVYTPEKAISYMIAGEAFRRIPRGSEFGVYPASEQFGPFRVSFDEGLSELVTEEMFYHSGTTSTPAPNPSALRHIAATGSSSVVQYEGSGAYFLDRVGDGVWRLEVYPDAAPTVDPFTRGSLERKAVRVLHARRTMHLALPDLGTGFTVRGANPGNNYNPAVADGAFEVEPGIYVIARADAAGDLGPDRILLAGETQPTFHAPDSDDGPVVVRHEPHQAIAVGEPFTISMDLVGPPVDSAEVVFRRFGDWRSTQTQRLERVDGAFQYAATLEAPAETGLGEYVAVVYQNGAARTFPSGEAGRPFDWDHAGSVWWQTAIVEPDAPVLLFDARRDLHNLLIPNRWQYVPFATEWTEGSAEDRLSFRATVESFEPSPHHLAIRSVLPPAHRNRLPSIGEKAYLTVRARATNTSQHCRPDCAQPLEVALVLTNGSAWSTNLSLETSWEDYRIPVRELRKSVLYLLPRPYPQFPPYEFVGSPGIGTPDLSRIEGLQFAIGGAPDDRNGGFEIERVTLNW